MDGLLYHPFLGHIWQWFLTEIKLQLLVLAHGERRSIHQGLQFRNGWIGRGAQAERLNLSVGSGFRFCTDSLVIAVGLLRACM